MAVDSRKFSQLTPGVTSFPAPSIHDVPQVGAVVSVDAKGVMVALDLMPDVLLGPCPWCLGSNASSAAAITAGFAPSVGDSVLLQFAGGSTDIPIVTVWWR